MRAPATGRQWTLEDIEADCIQSEQAFRLRRTSEPLEAYLEEFTTAKEAANAVIDRLPEILTQPANSELLATLAADANLCTALRYLAAPPISEDDLDTLLTTKLSARALRTDPALADGLVSLIRATIDPRRFPWIVDGTAPTARQLYAAKLASAVAATIQKVQTRRRGDEKKDLEGAVETRLLEQRYTRVRTPGRAIQHVQDLPGQREFMASVTLGGDNGDFVIGLPDRRHLALECKSSNSAINSRKRLNKEVVKDAENWRRQFGNQVVAGAVLRGVFHPRYVLEAQSTPLLIVWEHRLDDLTDFIEATRP
jgi:hypothetical protein